MLNEPINPRLPLLIQVVGGLLIGLILTAPIMLGLSVLLSLVLVAPINLEMALLLGVLIYPAFVAVGVSQIGRRQIVGGRYWYALMGAYGAVLLLGFIASGVVLISRQIGIGLLVALLILIPPVTATLRYRYLARPFDIMDMIDDDEFDLSAYQESGWEDY